MEIFFIFVKIFGFNRIYIHNSDRFKITKNRFYKYIWAIYNTIAICIVNKVLENNFRFKEFKFGIKTAFNFRYVEKKTV